MNEEKNLNTLEELSNQSADLIDEMNDEFFDNEEESGPSLELNVPTFRPVSLSKETSDLEKEFDLSSLGVDARDKMDESATGTSNFDALFDTLYNDVAGANNLITELIERKKTIHNNENLLSELKDKMEKEKADFNKYVEQQKKSLQIEKDQVNEYVHTQRLRIQSEEEKFNADVEATKTEISLAEQSLEAGKDRFNTEKEQFEKYKQLEEEKIKNERIKFDQEREHFEKERTVSEESIKAAQAELEKQKEQFEKYKELEEKKLELGNRNLSQSCARFKALVSQFNSGFSQLPPQDQA